MDEQVNVLQRQDVIEEVSEKPVCILAMQAVPKKNNKFRLVVDCRPVNIHIDTPKFSQEGISVVSEIIEKDDKMITIDLESGFYHVEIHPEFRKFLGFMWKGKYYVWKRMPFGVSCAPYFFNKILKPVINFLRENGIRIAPFVDDLLILLKILSMTDHIDFVINTLQELGWHLNWDKCQLQPTDEITFVGFILSTKRGIPWI